MDVTISGFKVRGDWEQVVKHGERITRALRESGVLNGEAPDDVDGSTAFAEWDRWRPKSHEGLDDEMTEKTAEQASVSEPDPEVDPPSVADELPEAEVAVREEAEAEEGDIGDVASSIAQGIDELARAVVRRAEETVYKRVMTQAGPQYFDNHLVSANLQRTEDGDVELFVFEVNVNDDDLKSEVEGRLEEYEAAEEASMEPDVAPEPEPETEGGGAEAETAPDTR